MGWWYVRRSTGENVGPLNESGVVAELDAGRLMPNGWVCPSGGTEWVLVSAQRDFVQAVERALLVLGEAPTAYTENEKQQRQLAALYEASIEGPSPVAQLPPSKRPTEPPPPAMQMAPQPGTAQRPAPTLAMTQPSPPVAQPAMAQPQPLQATASMSQQPMGHPPAAVPYAGHPAVGQPPATGGAFNANAHHLSVTGPVSTDAPFVPPNPLTESFGVVGWFAVALTGFTCFAYLIDAVVLVIFSLSWVVLVALLAAANFAWATVQLVRRRNVGFRLAFGGHGMLFGLVTLATIINVAASGALRPIMLMPVGLVLLHAVTMVFLHLGRSLFWIRD